MRRMESSEWTPVTADTPKPDTLLMRPIGKPQQLHIAMWDDGETIGSPYSHEIGWVDIDGWYLCNEDGSNGPHQFEYIEIPV
jgi:hypothetical protein